MAKIKILMVKDYAKNDNMLRTIALLGNATVCSA